MSALFPFTHCPPRSRAEAPLRVVVVERVPRHVLVSALPRDVAASAPITPASSTSQSTLVAPLGIISGSLGQTSAVVALKNRTAPWGSRPVSRRDHGSSSRYRRSARPANRARQADSLSDAGRRRAVALGPGLQLAEAVRREERLVVVAAERRRVDPCPIL